LIQDGSGRKGGEGAGGGLYDGAENVEEDGNHEHLGTTEDVGDLCCSRLSCGGDDRPEDGDCRQ